MPLFEYTAKKISGEEIRQTQEANDRFELARKLREEGLREKGYIITSCKEEKKRKIKFSFPLFFSSIFGYVSIEERMLFSRNLSVMLSSGLPISRALGVLIRQTKNENFQKIIENINSNIQKGESLSVSMEKYPNIFSDLFVAMVKSGEKSGKLPDSLNLISQQLEKDLTLIRRVRGALMYPSIIIFAMIGIGILMLIFVVPTLLSVFKELNVPLPITTKIIIFISNLITKNWLLGSTFLIIIITAILWLARTKKGKKIINIILIHLPFFSPLIKKMNASRTSRTLSSLLTAGVTVTEAFDVTKNVLQNHYYREVLEEAKEEIQKGAPIAQVFIKAENLFPSLVGEMVAVGEETGQLPDMLLRLGNFYDEEVNESTKNLTTIIEPILMIFIGAAVGFFAISMIQPMYSMLGGI